MSKQPEGFLAIHYFLLKSEIFFPGDYEIVIYAPELNGRLVPWPLFLPILPNLATMLYSNYHEIWRTI